VTGLDSFTSLCLHAFAGSQLQFFAPPAITSFPPNPAFLRSERLRVRLLPSLRLNFNIETGQPADLQESPPFFLSGVNSPLAVNLFPFFFFYLKCKIFVERKALFPMSPFGDPLPFARFDETGSSASFYPFSSVSSIVTLRQRASAMILLPLATGRFFRTPFLSFPLSFYA